MSDRDTHFQGFAKLEYEKLKGDIAALYVALGSKNEHDIEWAERLIQLVLAQCAYDLANHILLCADSFDLQMLTTEEHITKIPDMTEWPKTEPQAL